MSGALGTAQRLGFLGIGLMGEPMCLRLLAAGHPLCVWNRSAAKLERVLAQGAQAMATPAEVARASDVLLMCLTDQAAVTEVLFGAGGVAEGAHDGLVVIDFSSIAPAAARDHAARLAALSVGAVDAPVSGGTVGAQQGTLAVMAGGLAEHVEAARPVVALLAARFTHLGGPGAGQVAKLANQLIVGSLFPLLAEAVLLAEAGGVDAMRLPEALRGGFADSIPLQVFGPRIAARAWSPALGTAAVMQKDLDNAWALAHEAGLELPMLDAALMRYRALAASGRAGEEPSALIDLLGGSSPTT